MINEIRKNFATLIENRATLLNRVDSNYKSWSVSLRGFYGVAIQYSKTNEKVLEKFNNVKLWSTKIVINGIEESVLLLTSTEEELRYEFATICAEFVDIGENGEKREKLIKDPSKWWNNWKLLLGNCVKDTSVYSVMGELMVLEKLLLYGKKKPIWNGSSRSTHDIEMDGESYEVKSTISRYENTININSQYQLDSKNIELYLVFCRFEKTIEGNSLNNVIDRVVELGIDRKQIEKNMTKLGLEEGMSERNIRYKLHEMKKYKVDNNFPKIITTSFKNNKLPSSITSINYKIELSRIKYESWI